MTRTDRIAVVAGGDGSGGYTSVDAAAAWPQPLLVLMYHGIHDSRDDHGHYDPRYSVSAAAFAEQMALLGSRLESIWRPVQAARAANTQAPATNAPTTVMISFDDGDASNAERALPCLQQHGLHAVFFVSSHHLRRPGWLSVQQLRALGDAGMAVGSHGASHRFLNCMSAMDLRDELVDSRETLQQVSGRKVDWLALPGGRGSPAVNRRAFELGYQRVFGSQPGINRHRSSASTVQRVAITRNTTLEDFQQILAWRGPAVTALCWRHRMLALPKWLLGDKRYDRWRKASLR